MNYIIIHPDELGTDGQVHLEGHRARHIHDILGADIGKPVRIGVLNGGRGTGIIQKAEDNQVDLQCVIDQPPPPEPRVDLLLALPRPLVVKRLLPQLVAMGVRRIILTNANKVERVYFDTHWLRPEHYQPRMIEGLEQTGDTRLPELWIRKRLKLFLEDELDAVFPDSRRIMAHPTPQAEPAKFIPQNNERILLAVGPEGGWTDYELDMFAAHGFDRASLGWRTLKTETACVSLLTLAGMPPH